MKPLRLAIFTGLVALAAAHDNASAQFTLLSQDRSLSVYSSGNGSVYDWESDRQGIRGRYITQSWLETDEGSSTEAGAFSETLQVKGSVGSSSGSAKASLSSLISDSQISANGSFGADANASLPDGGMRGTVQSNSKITLLTSFSVADFTDVKLAYATTAWSYKSLGTYTGSGATSVVLTGPDTDIRIPNVPSSEQMLRLAPGTYELKVTSSAYSWTQPDYGSGGGSFNLSFMAVPEPSTTALMGLGLLALAVAARGRQARQAHVLP